MTTRELASDWTALIEDLMGRGRKALAAAAAACVQSLETGGKILAFGNGGSAAEAQHFTAELVNRFQRARRAIPAVSLATDASVLTSIGNDASFRSVFSRQVEALGSAGDVALALSTSGNSPNVVAALRTARKKGLVTVGLCGKGGGAMAPLCDHLVEIASASTPRIQEMHLVVLHFLAETIEARLS